MWPLGHAAVGYLCYTLATRGRAGDSPTSAAVVALLVGTQFPDLVDKPLAWYLGVLPAGRSLAHSLVVLGPLCAGCYLLARRHERSELGVAFGVGALSHPLVDALPALWTPGLDAAFLLYPIVGVETYEDGAPTAIELLLATLPEPWFQLEFVLAALALTVWSRDGAPGLGVPRRLARRVVAWQRARSDVR